MQQNTFSKQLSSQRSAKLLKKPNRERIGYISFDGQNSSIPCSVREFDETGAVLSMNGWLAVPEEFPLYVEPDRIQVTCKVLKKRGSKVQVSFKHANENTKTR